MPGPLAYGRIMSEPNLPVLDLAQLDAGPQAAARFRADLRAATHDVGFFYLTGTGVPVSSFHMSRSVAPR